MQVQRSAMSLTQSAWSSLAGSSSLQHNFGSSRTRTGDLAALFLLSRCSCGQEYRRSYVVAFSSFQVDPRRFTKVLRGWLCRGSKPTTKMVHLGFDEKGSPCVASTNGEKPLHVIQALTEETGVGSQEAELLQLRRPSSARKVEIETTLVESTELAIYTAKAAKILHTKRKSRKTHLKVRRGERPYQEQRPSLRSCNPRIDEVMAALKKIMDGNGSVDMVMEQYQSISKTDISGILTEFQLRQDWRGALQFFKWMKNQCWYSPNSRQYTRLIGFLGREGKVDLACIHFQEMLLEKCKPDLYTFTAMVNAYGKAKMYDEALDVFSYMKVAQDVNCRPTTVTCNALIDSLVKGGRYDLAIKIFSDMKLGKNGLDSKCIPNVVTYNILVDVLCKDGHVRDAVRVLYRMTEGDEEHVVSPNVSTYNTVINACGKNGLYDKAEELLEHMIEYGHEPDRITYTALIDAYGKAGLCESAENMFLGMRSSHIQVDVMAYTAMIDAYAREGHHEKAEGLFKMMVEAGQRPNQITYLALIEAYGKSGLPLAAHEVFVSMENAGCRPNVLHYSALISAYGKAGLHSEAADVYMVMKRSGCQPNLITLSAILASAAKCVTWGDAADFLRCLQWSRSELEHALYNFLVGGEESLWGPALRTLDRVRDSKQLRQSLYNALLDVLWRFELKARAARVITLSKQHGIYTDEYCKEEWNVDLHGLSVGGAMVALLTWLDELHVAWLWGEDVPARVRIITGKGKHSKTKMSALKVPIENLMRELHSPFASKEEDYGGYLVASGYSVKTWLSDPSIKQKLQFSEIVGDQVMCWDAIPLE